MSRSTSIIIAIVSLVALAFAGLAVVLDNPELYRDRITQAVKEQTGFELKINGSIDWRIFPPVGITINDIEITPAGSDMPLASLKSASVDIKLIPLILQGDKVEVDGISIDGLVVNARVNRQGVPNWQPVPDSTTPAEDNTSAPESGPDNGDSDSGLQLDVQSFSVTNTQIHYIDESENTDYIVTITRLTTGVLKPGQITDIRGEISFADKINRLRVSGNLSGQFGISQDRQQLALHNLTLILDKSTLTGTATLTLAPKTRLAFTLDMDSITVSDYMAPASVETVTSANRASARPLDNEIIPVALLSAVDVDGSFTLGQLRYHSYRLTDIKTTLTNQRGRLHLGVSAKAFDGALSLKTALHNLTPGGSVTGTNTVSVTGINIGTVAGFQAIAGIIALDSNTTFSGSMLSQLLDSLDGKSSFTLTNGSLDVAAIKQAGVIISALQGKPNDLAAWPERMPFTQMTGSHTFNHGVADGQEFSFDTEFLSIEGTGGMDYFANSIHYDIRAELEQDPKGRFTVSDHLTGIKWPLRCEGNLDAGVVRLCSPDRGAIKALLKEIARRQLKNKGREKLLEQVDKYKGETRELFKRLFH